MTACKAEDGRSGPKPFRRRARLRGKLRDMALHRFSVRLLIPLARSSGLPDRHHLAATLLDLDRATLAGGFVLETVGAFFLANTVLNTTIRGAAGRFTPFAIGVTVSPCIMAFGPITSGSLNPARTLGPAIADNDYSQISIYLAVQVTGAVLAGLLYRFV